MLLHLLACFTYITRFSLRQVYICQLERNIYKKEIIHINIVYIKKIRINYYEII